MESSKRSRNFTEREKMLLIEVAKEFVVTIDNKKTDGTTIEAKKQAWMELTTKFNAVSETGSRTEKQLHALYDNLKKKARKNMSDDKSEMYKTGGGTFCPKTTTIDEKIVALLTPQFQPLPNEFDSSAAYYNYDNTPSTSTQTQILPEVSQMGTDQDLIVLQDKENLIPQSQLTEEIKFSKRLLTSPMIQEYEGTPKVRKMCLTETKKNNINKLSSSIIKRKNQKQINEDAVTVKKLEILELQKQQEEIKLEKTRICLDLDIELKRILLESAKMDLEIKKRNFK